MSALQWDKAGEHFYETGTNKAVLYPQVSGEYPLGIAWNGITGVTESPSGAEASPVHADNIKYLSLRSTEEYGATIEAYTSPEEFDYCDGSASPVDGIKISQQTRQSFGFSWQTRFGNDEDGDNYSYKIHIIYGATAAPSERGYTTINDSPEAMTLSWTVDTVPINVAGYKPTASLEIDAWKLSPAQLKALEDVLYGTDNSDPHLPLPDELFAIVAAAATYTAVTPVGTENPSQEGWYERSGSAEPYTYTLTTDTTVDVSKTYYKKD